MDHRNTIEQLDTILVFFVRFSVGFHLGRDGRGRRKAANEGAGVGRGPGKAFSSFFPVKEEEKGNVGNLGERRRRKRERAEWKILLEKSLEEEERRKEWDKEIFSQRALFLFSPFTPEPFSFPPAFERPLLLLLSPSRKFENRELPFFRLLWKK